MIRILMQCLTPVLVILFAACGGGGGSGTDQQQPPTANAGLAQNVFAGTLVTLDGSASTDANGDQLTYSWSLTTKPAGSAVALTLSTSAKPTFTADKVGIYVASLIVNDGKVNSTTATVTVTATVANTAPVANAGLMQDVFAGTLVTLDGSASSDANGDQLTFGWTLTSKPAGSAAVLASANLNKPTFTADLVGTYVASLTVSDGKATSTPVTVKIAASLTDTAGPVVSEVTLSPASVDVTQADQTITATVNVTDQTGVDLARLASGFADPIIYNAIDVQGTRRSAGPWILVSGDAKSGTYRAVFSVSKGSKPDQWSFTSLAFLDTLGFSSTNGGHQASFTVQNTSVADTAGPVVSEVTLSPASVDVTQADQTITATVTVTDQTGVDSARLASGFADPIIYNVIDVQGTRRSAGPWMLVSGDAKSGTYRAVFSVLKGSKPGQWSFTSLAFLDTLGFSSTNGGHQASFNVR